MQFIKNMKFYKFYLNNYQFIHHLIGLAIYYAIFRMANFNLFDPKNILITLPMLPIAYCTTILAWKFSGLPETIEKEKTTFGAKQSQNIQRA